MKATIVNRGATIKTVRVTDLPVPSNEMIPAPDATIAEIARCSGLLASVYDAALEAAGETRSSLWALDHHIYADDPDAIDVYLHTD